MNLGVMQGRLSLPEKNKIQSFPWLNWSKEFKIAKKLKINIIEWTLDYNRIYKNPLMTKDGKKKIKKLSKKHKVKICSVTGDCFMQQPFWKEKNIYKRKKLIDDLKNIILNCSELGIKMIILPLVDGGKIENIYQEKILINNLKNIKKMLDKNKVFILFETDFAPKKYLLFLKKLKSKYFGVNYDIGNSAAMGYDCEKDFKFYGNYIKNVHVKDRKLKGSTVSLGTGDANFNRVFNGLKKIDYNGNYIIQGARGERNKEILTIKNYKNFIKSFF